MKGRGLGSCEGVDLISVVDIIIVLKYNVYKTALNYQLNCLLFMELFLTLRLCNIFDLSTSTADAVINIRANDLDDLEHVTRETMATDNSSGEIYDVECVDDSHLQQVSI